MIRRLGLIVWLALFAGCGADDAAHEQTDAVDSLAVGPENEALAFNEAHLSASKEGRFEAVWPSGCAQLRTRTIPSSRNPGDFAVVDMTCQRDGDMNRGARVTVYNEMTDGGMPSPDAVTTTIGEIISSLGVEIRKQRPIERQGREGVAALCGEREGTRQVWIEGFIDQGRVLMVMAWGLDDGLYTDPEIKAFFDSVRLTD